MFKMPSTGSALDKISLICFMELQQCSTFQGRYKLWVSVTLTTKSQAKQMRKKSSRLSVTPQGGSGLLSQKRGSEDDLQSNIDNNRASDYYLRQYKIILGMKLLGYFNILKEILKLLSHSLLMNSKLIIWHFPLLPVFKVLKMGEKEMYL